MEDSQVEQLLIEQAQLEEPIVEQKVLDELKPKEEEPEPVVVILHEVIENPSEFPWDIETGSVDEIKVINTFEFIPGKLRGQFMDEVDRVLKPKGLAMFLVPHWSNDMAYHDYRYEWPPLSPQSFLIFNKDWRELNQKKLTLSCNFDFTYGFKYDEDTESRNAETQAYHIKRYINCAAALQLVFSKR